MNAPRPWSLRRRLTGRVLALVSGAWLATVVVSAPVLDHEMNEMFDGELQALAETTLHDLDTAQASVIPRTPGVQAGDGERELRILSPDRAAGPAPWPVLAGDGFRDAPGWRILRVSGEGVVIEAAHATTWRREEMLEAASAFLALALPLIGLLVWGLRGTVGEATAPVARLAGAVAARGPDDLSPVGTHGLPAEAQPLADALDGDLARIEALRQSERAFIANAAHELRIPLAAMRSRLSLSADADARAAIATLDALTRRVERLLQLSRLEAGVGLGRGPCDPVRILHLLIDDLAPRARHPLRFDDGDLESLPVAADVDALAILLRNLIENALDHGTGPVRITLAPAGTLTIENPADHPSLPGTRHSPGPASPGAGLGLSIVRDLGVPLVIAVGPDRVRIDLRLAPSCELRQHLPG